MRREIENQNLKEEEINGRLMYIVTVMTLFSRKSRVLHRRLAASVSEVVVLAADKTPPPPPLSST